MDTSTSLRSPSMKGLPGLPNELLIEITSNLRAFDILRLRRVNHRLFNFVQDYLQTYKYKAKLLSLPDKVIHNIAENLETQSDRRDLARVSSRLYSPVTSCIAQYDVQSGENRMLGFAVYQNQAGVVAGLLRMGAGPTALVTYWYDRGFTGEPTSFALAVYYGYEKIVQLLLEAGVEQPGIGLAISRRHESIAMKLTREFYTGRRLEETGLTVLQSACEARMVNLVRFYLEQEHSEYGSDKNLRDRNTALFILILGNETREWCDDDNYYIERELHEEVYQIAMLLLQHNADPNIPIKRPRFKQTTARALASRHPDPRVRNLFPRTKVPNISDQSTQGLNYIEQFPRLAQALPSSDNTAKDFWTLLPKDGNAVNKNEAL